LPEAQRKARLAEWAVNVLVPDYVGRSARPFQPPSFPAFLGVSPPVENLRLTFARVAERNRATVLIRGASGTGKQIVARGIHDLGARAKKPFVEVNCTALPDTLLETELFGREKGAYTDAYSSRQGLIETAGDGTVFLDEIGHMTEKLQMALLKVIEQRTFRRVGGTEERTTAARFVAATSRNLEEAITAGAFRSDLYYRLNVFTINLPDLRERDADVLLLAHHYAREYAVDYDRPVSGITGDAALMLLEHRWPGNVRELKNIMERAVVFHDTMWVGSEALPLEGRSAQTKVAETAKDPALAIDPSGAIKISIPPWGISLEALERAVIEAALRATSYNITKTAKLLFITRDTLRYRMKKFGLRMPQ
jgi:DNA-binding NtrC family response regulator